MRVIVEKMDHAIAFTALLASYYFLVVVYAHVDTTSSMKKINPFVGLEYFESADGGVMKLHLLNDTESTGAVGLGLLTATVLSSLLLNLSNQALVRVRV